MYFATKNRITKEIQKKDRYLYEMMGWEITTDGNNPYDPFDYEMVNEKGNCLQNIIINGESFDRFSSFNCVNTKTYVTEPQRTITGAIPDINNYETFIVPRVKVTFQYMSINDFRRFIKATTPNEFIVEYYDYEIDRKVNYKMYVEPRDMANLHNLGYEILGVKNIEISLIATLNDVEKITIEYKNMTSDETGTIETLLDSREHIFGQWLSIIDGSQFVNDEYSEFVSWNTNPDGSGKTYTSNQVIVGENNLVLYAQWRKN